MAGPSSKGKKLYRCDECKVARFVHWTETAQAARLRCRACGSARMEISVMGAEDQARLNAEAADRRSATLEKGTGSAVPVRGATSKPKKRK